MYGNNEFSGLPSGVGSSFCVDKCEAGVFSFISFPFYNVLVRILFKQWLVYCSRDLLRPCVARRFISQAATFSSIFSFYPLFVLVD